MRIAENQRVVLGPPGCVDAETEFLSPTGWKRIDSWAGEKVCQYNLHEHSSSWVEPIEYIVRPCDEMIHFHNDRGIDQMLSFEHRVLWYSKSHGRVTGPFVSPARSVVEELERVKYPIVNLPVSVLPPGGEGIPLTDEELRVMVAFIADGTLSNQKKGVIRIKKKRKHERLVSLLTAARIEFTVSEYPCEKDEGYKRYGFIPPIRTKVFDEYWWGCSKHQLSVIAEELVYWDGSFRKRDAEQFFTSNKKSADFAQYAYMSTGKSPRLRTCEREDGSVEYSVYLSNRQTIGIVGGGSRSTNVSVVRPSDGRMYCFEVPSTFLVLRRNGQIFITGNTGKTSHVLSEVDKLIQSGEEPERIALVSFTKKAVTEAVDRACDKFSLKPRELPMFRTVHSLAFNALGISKKEVMGREHLRDFGEWLGYRFEGTWDEAEGPPIGSDLGDALMFLDNLARITKKPLKQVWEENYEVCEWAELERFQDAYQDYKSSHSIMDFTDMLSSYIAMCDPTGAKYVFVDEAQDLSPLQWDVLKHAFGTVRLATIAGDDDQAIYKWSGADVDSFLRLEGDKHVLSHSYRLPRAVHEFAQVLINRVEHRFDKKFTPRDADGELEYVNHIDHVAFDSEERTLFLMRNIFLADQVKEHLNRLGVPYIGRTGYPSVKAAHVQAIYAVENLRKQKPILGSDVKSMYDHMRVGYYLDRGFKAKIAVIQDNEVFDYSRLNQEYGLRDLGPWYDMLEGIHRDSIEYYRRVLANGYSLRGTPPASIATIHSAKGGEADHVVLLSDMAYRSHQEYLKEPDNERRVAYVGVTRAKSRLTIVQPQTKLAFDYFLEGSK